jgi:hypothetical protein
VLEQEMAELHRTLPGRPPPRPQGLGDEWLSAPIPDAAHARALMSGAGTDDGTDRAVHGSALSDVFGVASTGATTQSSQRLRARSLGAGRRPSSSSSRVVKTPARRVCACVA